MDAQTLKIIAILVVALTQLLDWHSTMAFLRSGHGREGNQRLARLFVRYGASKVMVLKGLAHVVVLGPVIWFVPVAGGLALAGVLLVWYFFMIRQNYRIARGEG